jgi:hypothetical protein
MNHKTQVAELFRAMNAIAQKITLCLLVAAMFFGLMQPAVQAGIQQADESPSVSAESLEQKRAQRREIQSRASEAANTEESADSVGEALGEKLNLNQIVEENEIVDEVKQALDTDDTKK